MTASDRTGIAGRHLDLKSAGAGLLTQVLALNRAEEQATSPLDAAALAALVAAADLAVTWADAGQAEAFILGFRPGATYASPNYRWFCDRLDDFLYIDRVVVAAAARGRGLARGLYRLAAASAGDAALVCEVNLDPPNPGSDAFHAALGFAEMGRGSPAAGKTVRYLVRRP